MKTNLENWTESFRNEFCCRQNDVVWRFDQNWKFSAAWWPQDSDQKFESILKKIPFILTFFQYLIVNKHL